MKLYENFFNSQGKENLNEYFISLKKKGNIKKFFNHLIRVQKLFTCQNSFFTENNTFSVIYTTFSLAV